MIRGLLVLACACVSPLRAGALEPVGREELRVTEGEIAALDSGELSIDRPKVRAVLRAPRGDTAELSFRLIGPSAELVPLESGERRQQLGLKLRAADGCNVVYVMWRVEPESALAISVKRNPGQSRSASCGARGYRALARVPLPRPGPGGAHVLGAALDEDRLSVRVDGREVYAGALGEEVRGMQGPVGLRTDNVRLAFRLSAGPRSVGTR